VIEKPTAVHETVVVVDKLRTNLQAICDEMIETRCALEETEEKNAELTVRNAELEQIITQLKAELLEKSRRVEELKIDFEKRQCERNKYWGNEIETLENKLKKMHHE
jgi:chromosome segregation ATPase